MVKDRDEPNISGGFFLALILTHRLEVEKTVVKDAVHSLPTGDDSDQAFLAHIAGRAWEVLANHPGICEASGSELRLLQLEPQQVLELPRHEQFCLCLRVLATMTAATCGRLMDLQPEQVDHYLRLSAQMLWEVANTMAKIELPWTTFSQASYTSTQGVAQHG
jgi:hypothetical protein